ncbi:MAG: amino acid ABC transporter substrate-binding protein [Ramlibacter sp.]|nr:amino acid ABC transporter substrate-binding protein [Ramlibacter sp.]
MFRCISPSGRWGLWLALVVVASPALVRAEDQLKRIAQRDQINLGYREDAPPFSFLDAKRQPVGYSLDFCRAMAERIKLETGKPNLRVRLVPVPADQLERVVASGGVDLMCAGTSDTPGRRARMAFSQPVFLSSVKFMVPAKARLSRTSQLNGKTVAVLGRTTAEPAVKAYAEQAGLNLKVARVVSPEAALSQLQLGQAAAFARDEVLLLQQRAGQTQPDALELLPESISTEVIAIALPRDAGLQRVADQTMALMVRSGQAEALYAQWFVKPHAGAPKGLNLPLSPALKAEFDKLR